MDIQTISTLISSVGFPILACVFMWKAFQDVNRSHKEEMEAMQKSINQNTLVLTELKQMLQDMHDIARGGVGTDEAGGAESDE